MSFNCTFNTNNLEEYRGHLNGAHEGDNFGPLRCSVCLGKASEPEKLIKHIVTSALRWLLYTLGAALRNPHVKKSASGVFQRGLRKPLALNRTPLQT